MSQLSANFDASPFDAIRHEDTQGEWWSARELAELLGYKPASWHNFEGVLNDAMIACKKSGNVIESNFYDAVKIKENPKRIRELKDYRLTRYACYLVAQNADPAKEIVAQAQTYLMRAVLGSRNFRVRRNYPASMTVKQNQWPQDRVW